MQIGFLGALTLIFVLAKLLGKLDWSWWWVFAPMWISALIALVVFLGGALLVAVSTPRRPSYRPRSW